MKRLLRFVLTAVLVVAFLFSIFVFPVVLLLLGVPAVLILTDFKSSRVRMMSVFRWFPWVGGKPVPLGGTLLSWAVLATVLGVLSYHAMSNTAASPPHAATTTAVRVTPLPTSAAPAPLPNTRVVPTNSPTTALTATRVVKARALATVRPTQRITVHPTARPAPRPTVRPTTRPTPRPALRATPRPVVKPAPSPTSAEVAWTKNYSDTLNAMAPLSSELTSAGASGQKGDFTTALSYVNQAQTTLSQTRAVWNAGPPPPSGNVLDSALNADLDAAIHHFTVSAADLHQGLVNQDAGIISQGATELNLATADISDVNHRLGLR